MIISFGRKYVFVHVPKTGGTSMTLALEARAKRDDVIVADTPKGRRRRRRLDGLRPRGRLWKHSTLADIDGILGPEALTEMFVFTLVRNPWDRVVSYYHWLRGQSFDHPAVALARSEDFAGFLGHEQVRRSLRAASYASYMRDASGQERASLYLPLERLEEGVDILSDRLGFRPELPHVNRSRRAGTYRDAHDARTRAIVAEICAEDIARFGYRFDALAPESDLRAWQGPPGPGGGGHLQRS